jgi:phage terminase large subunit-like protein
VGSETVKNAVGKFWRTPMQGFDPWANVDPTEYRFDPRIANRVIRFIESNLKHSKGEFAGRSFKLEPWQKWFVGHLFGWVEVKTGFRRFRKAFVYVPRKNGKTFVTAALGLVLFISDNEPGAEVYCCAAETSQAALVYNEAAAMVNQNPQLSEDIRVLPGYKSMQFPLTNSFWRVLSSEAATKHGLNPSAYIVDEVHAQRKAELMEVMETGTGARRQPLGLYLTTADFAGDSPCNRLVDHARNVRDNKLPVPDMRFFPLVYEARRNVDDWESEETWRRVNPNYGVSIRPEYMRDQYQKAKNDPAFENTFKRLHLNMQTEQERRWMQMTEWDQSGCQLDPAELDGQECFLGIDLASVNDIEAVVAYFPSRKACLCWFWVPSETAKKRVEYEVWERQGYISVSEGRVLDQSIVRAKINELKDKYKIRQIAYDPWNAAQFAKELGDQDGFEMVEFRQGYKSMNEPTKALMAMVLKRELVHFGNPVLRWMAANAQAQEDPAGNIKLVKPGKDSPLKVDGLIALVMAYGLSMVADAAEAGSVYDAAGDSMDKLLEEIYGK